MKNQYFGDVNDYRKYGLLRGLTDVSRLRVGVCWMLTPDDGSGDGERRKYLTQPGRWRRYDSALFDALCGLLQRRSDRSVRHARDWGLLADAEYFERTVTDAPAARQEYFSEAFERLAGCELMFLDPDNGIEVSNPQWGGRGSAKYIYWRELKAAFSRGHSLLIYQTYPRVPRERFVPFLADRIADELKCSHVSAFKTPHVAFFLAQQPAHLHALEGVASAVAAQWPGQIEPWPDTPLEEPAKHPVPYEVRERTAGGLRSSVECSAESETSTRRARPGKGLVGPASGRDNRSMRTFTLEYWQDDGWYVGRLKEMAGVVSQGQTIGELEENIRDAYQLMTDAEPAPTAGPILTREIEV